MTLESSYLVNLPRAFDTLRTLEAQIAVVINICSLLTYHCAHFSTPVLFAYASLFFFPPSFALTVFLSLKAIHLKHLARQPVTAEHLHVNKKHPFLNLQVNCSTQHRSRSPSQFILFYLNTLFKYNSHFVSMMWWLDKWSKNVCCLCNVHVHVTDTKFVVNGVLTQSIVSNRFSVRRGSLVLSPFDCAYLVFLAGVWYGWGLLPFILPWLSGWSCLQRFAPNQLQGHWRCPALRLGNKTLIAVMVV